MTKHYRGFMGFRDQNDAERYCESSAPEDAKAVRALFDAGKAVYATEGADYVVTERFERKTYVKIENPELWRFPLYISARVADLMRWKRVTESEYRAEDWIEAAFFAWKKDDLERVDRLFACAVDAPNAQGFQIAKALLLRAAVIEFLGRPLEALALLDRIESEFSASDDERVQPYVAEAREDRIGLLRRTRCG